MDLNETNAAARAEGQSYGIHVAQSGPQVEVTVPPGLMSQKEKAAMDAALPSHPEPEPEPEPDQKPAMLPPLHEPEGFEKTCPQCGRVFRVLTGKSRKKYCSPDCLKDAQYQRYKQRKAAKSAEPVQEEPTKEPEPIRSEPQKRPITFGDILGLLGRDSTEVELRMGDDNISGAADSRLWRNLEDELVVNIGENMEYGGIVVWLKEPS